MINGIIHSGQEIVTNGLVLHLDAAQLRSYPGSGTTWFDLSGNNYHATLVNGVGFSNLNGGVFLLDNVNDEIVLNGINWNTLGSSRNFTFMFAAKKLYYGTGGNGYGNSALIHGAITGYYEGWRINEDNIGTPGNAFTGNQLYSFQAPEIRNVLNVSDTLPDRFGITAFSQNASSVFGFLNGNIATKTFSSGYTNGTNNGVMGRAQMGVGQFAGYLSFVMVYNRALSAAEVLQNYNATKSRFGL